MKCPKCGSEYFSSAPTCYACSRLERPVAEEEEVSWRRAIALLLGAIFIGFGNPLLLIGPDLVPIDARIGFVTFCVFVISFGAGIVSYSLLYSKTSLKEFREGKELSNRGAAGAAALGLGIMVFIPYYLNAAYYFEFTPRLFEVLGLLLPLSILLIIAGLYRRPRFLFRTQEMELDASRRTTIGSSILAIGFIAQMVMFAYGSWRPSDAVIGAWILYMLFIGPIVVIAGIAVLWGPMGRPWIPGEHRAQEEDQAETSSSLDST
ncbi:MAG: hypothetical protein JSV90_07775 [Methanobacteriota archaeon]|nr:MAG: hypothetical protein JSV90_07775 [Euryarchaeota archaeon]